MGSKEGVTKIVFKSIGYVVLGAVVLFVLAIIVGFIHIYRESRPVISSDSKFTEQESWKRITMLREIQHAVQDFTPLDPPENAYDLYGAKGPGFLLPDSFISFRMNSKEECESLFENKDYFQFKDFEKGTLAEDGPWQHYEFPHEWGKQYQDRNWPLKEGDEFLYRGDYQELILYVPKEHRFYICINGGPG